MSLHASDRFLFRSIIFCSFGLMYFLRLALYPNVSEFVENQTEITNKDRGSFIERSRDTITQNVESTANLKPQRVLSDDDRNIISRLRNKKWIHKQKVKFVHPAIELLAVSKSERKRHGVFAVDPIAFGTILSIEDPIFNVPKLERDPLSPSPLPKMSYIDRMVREQTKHDPEFKKVWNHFPVHSDTYSIQTLKHNLRADTDYNHDHHDVSSLNNYVRFVDHKIPSHRPWIVYSVIGRVRFALPPNAMIVVGDKKNGYKAALIATKAIEKGEEILMDHFMDWTESYVLQREDPDFLTERMMMCHDRDFDLNQDWIGFIQRLQEDIQSAKGTKIVNKELILALYPSGLIGTVPDGNFKYIKGCEGMDSIECTKKVELVEQLQSGSIFDVKAVQSQQNRKCSNGKKQCKKREVLEDHGVLSKEQVQKAFYYDPQSVNERKLVTHPVHTKFVHSALKLKYFGDDKQYGLITTKKIPFGSVLVVEYPLLLINEIPGVISKLSSNGIAKSEAMIYEVGREVDQRTKVDRHFDRIWNEELRANKKAFLLWLNRLVRNKKDIPLEQIMIHWTKFNKYWFRGHYGSKPLAVYSVLSRINHGIPQNVAAIFGDKNDDFVFVLIATRDLKKGEELQLDYMQNLHLKKGLSAANEWIRKNRGPEFGWKWTDELRSLVVELHSEDITKKEKRKLMHEYLYSNGIIGKESGQKLRINKQCGDWLTKRECKTKKAIIEDIENGELFKILRDEKPAPQWMGEEYVEQSSTWR